DATPIKWGQHHHTSESAEHDYDTLSPALRRSHEPRPPSLPSESRKSIDQKHVRDSFRIAQACDKTTPFELQCRSRSIGQQLEIHFVHKPVLGTVCHQDQTERRTSHVSCSRNEGKAHQLVGIRQLSGVEVYRLIVPAHHNSYLVLSNQRRWCYPQRETKDQLGEAIT